MKIYPLILFLFITFSILVIYNHYLLNLIFYLDLEYF